MVPAAGAGKTILAYVTYSTRLSSPDLALESSVVINYLDDLASQFSDVCVAFVYCRYTEPMAVRDILAALVRQLLERYPQLQSAVDPLYKKHTLRNTQP